MTAKRRPSVRTRMKAEDVSCWVEHNQQPGYSPHEEVRVRFEAPPPPARDDSDAESVESLTESPKALDGGYGWFVVLCSFIMHAVCDGASFGFGIVYILIQKYYQVDRVASMITAALFLSLPLCCSPLAGLTSDIHGCRKSILIGSGICAMSCFLAVFCPDIWLFTIFFGFGCGIGMSFIYNAAIVKVTYYFNKKRGVATSLAVAGTGCGTFLCPLYTSLVTTICTPFVNELQSCLIAYCVAFSLIFVIGIIIRDVEWESDSKDFKLRQFNRHVKNLLEDQETNQNTKKDAVLRRANSLPNLNAIRVDFGSIQSVCDAGKADGKVEVPARSKSVALFQSQPPMLLIPEYSMINTTLANLEHLDLELANSPCTTVKAQRRRVISKVSMSVDQINELDEEDFKANLFLSSTESSSECGTESSSDDSEMSQDGDSSSSELSEKQMEPTTKLVNKNLTAVMTRATSSAPTSARQLRNSLAPGTTNMSGGRILASNAIQSRYATNLLTMGKIPSAPMLVIRKNRKNMAYFQRMTKNEWPTFKEVLSCRAYQYLLVSVMCLYFILDVPYVCLMDYGTETLALSETFAKSIYSVIGGCNFISTIMFGKLADFKYTRDYVQTIYTISMVGVSFVLVLAIFVSNAWQFIFAGGLFGVVVTSNYVLQSILVTVCFDDMNLFQGAYSVISMLEGVASLIGPPIFAFIREHTGSYTPVFVISSVIMLISAFFAHLFARELEKMVQSRKEESDDESVDMAEKKSETTPRMNGNFKELESLLDV